MKAKLNSALSSLEKAVEIASLIVPVLRQVATILGITQTGADE